MVVSHTHSRIDCGSLVVFVGLKVTGYDTASGDTSKRRNVSEGRGGTINSVDAEKEKLTVDFDGAVAGGVTAVVGFDNVKPETPVDPATEASKGADGKDKAAAAAAGAGTAAASSAESPSIGGADAVVAASPVLAFFPQFGFLEAGKDLTPVEEVMIKWEEKQSMRGQYASENCISAAKAQITLALDLMHEHAPKYGEKDFVMVRRKGAIEIWTLRPFPKNSLVLLPYTREMKDSSRVYKCLAK